MKKQLLNESEIRRMMKFANIGSLTDGFVDRLDESAETTPLEEEETLEEDETLEEMSHAKDDDDVQEEGKHAKDDDDVKKEGMGHYGKADDDDVKKEGMQEELDDEDPMPEPEEEDSMPEPEMDAAPGEMELSEEEAQILISLGQRLEGEMGGADMDPVGDMPDMGDPEEEDEGMELEEDFVNEVLSRVVRRLKDSK